MVPHLYLSIIVLSSMALGACLASMWWQRRARRLTAEAYERGWVFGLMDNAPARARQVDAGYRAGYVAAQRDAQYPRLVRPGRMLIGRN